MWIAIPPGLPMMLRHIGQYSVGRGVAGCGGSSGERCLARVWGSSPALKRALGPKCSHEKSGSWPSLHSPAAVCVLRFGIAGGERGEGALLARPLLCTAPRIGFKRIPPPPPRDRGWFGHRARFARFGALPPLVRRRLS
ncbi:hypothetical protein DQ04_12051000, partial [Trypanosoma grayi]|uniref:hypothetical protein n=1 Tax=Trypanosoma grayi TaxID=71804 RepID=UPI0004F4945E